MFTKQGVIPRKSFQMDAQQIQKDIEAVCNIEEQRNKLYLCLDEKPPQEDTFCKIGEFLKGSDELENIIQKIEFHQMQLKETTNEIEQRVKRIKQKANVEIKIA